MIFENFEDDYKTTCDTIMYKTEIENRVHEEIQYYLEDSKDVI